MQKPGSRNSIDLWLHPVHKGISTSISPPKLQSLLSPRELHRYRKFKVGTKKDEFLCSRFLLRHIVGSYTDIDPLKVEAIPDSYGRPFLVADSHQVLPYISLSHTSDMILCAVSWIKEIGCDIEKVGRIKSEEKLISQIFAAEEKEIYLSLDKSERSLFFYHSWTLKEALVKAVGLGFRIAPRALSFTHKVPIQHKEAISIDVEIRPHTSEKNWCFQSFSPAPGYIASIATTFNWGQCKNKSVFKI